LYCTVKYKTTVLYPRFLRVYPVANQLIIAASKIHQKLKIAEGFQDKRNVHNFTNL